MKRLLLIGDDNDLLKDFVLTNSERFELLEVSSKNGGVDSIQNENPSAVFIDIDTIDCPELKTLRTICETANSDVPVYALSSSPDIEIAVNAMKIGASDFFQKNQDGELFAARILSELDNLTAPSPKNENETPIEEHHDRLVFASEVMKTIFIEMNRMAKYSADCLLIGETGVGKDLIASELHKRSSRRDKPFISVPVGSLTHTILESELFGYEKGAFSGAEKRKIGKFEAANGGTIYIPEISELSRDIQLKLLHFMQYKSINRVGQDARNEEIKVDARIIMATNERLEDLVKEGRIRKDFYYRISAVRIEVPPLRKRPEDIIPLANYFLDRFTNENLSQKFTFDEMVLDAFMKYPWHGNIREMKNMIERAIISALFSNADRGKTSVLTLEQFPDLTESKHEKQPGLNLIREKRIIKYKIAQEDFKRQYFTALLEQTDGKISEAAKIAGITPQAIRKIISQLGIR